MDGFLILVFGDIVLFFGIFIGLDIIGIGIKGGIFGFNWGKFFILFGLGWDFGFWLGIFFGFCFIVFLMSLKFFVSWCLVMRLGLNLLFGVEDLILCILNLWILRKYLLYRFLL